MKIVDNYENRENLNWAYKSLKDITRARKYF